MPSTAAPTVRLDSEDYEAVAKSFLLRFLTTLLDQADRLGLVRLGADCQLSNDDLGRAHSLGFALLATFEDRDGFRRDGGRWFINPLFTTSLPSEAEAVEYLGSVERTALHGSLDDDLLQAAANAVCASRRVLNTDVTTG